MPVYLSPVLGNGSETNPYSPVALQPGGGWIDLRAPDASGPQRFIGWLPVASGDVRLLKLADSPLEVLALASRTALNTALGITLTGVRGSGLNGAIAELLLDIATARAGAGFALPLTPSTLRNQHEIWLGDQGIVWSAPTLPQAHSQSHVELWPTPGTNMAVQTLAWQAFGTAHNNVVAGPPQALQSDTAGLAGRIVTSAAVCDTDNNEVFGIYDFVSEAANDFIDVCARVDGTGFVSCYSVFAQRNSTPNHVRRHRRRVTSAFTTLNTDTTDPGTGLTVRCTCDGSTQVGVIGTFSSVVTDTNVTSGKFACLQVGCGGATGNAQLESMTVRDVILNVRRPTSELGTRVGTRQVVLT